MNNFMNYDFNITDIRLAIFVKQGMDAPVHKNRTLHGLAINIDPNNKTYMFSGGKIILVAQNEIIYLPKGSNYTVSSVRSGNCYAINFDFSENISFEPFTFKAKNAPAFIKEFEKATELWKNKSTAFNMQCKGILYNIISMMQNEHALKYISRSTSNIITPAIEYIKENYTNDDITISQLADMCGISEDYFRKIFKTSFSVSPRKYINELKLSYAKELILSGMYTVTEAAELSGYTDISYFSREFKKAFNTCPAAYKKTL